MGILYRSVLILIGLTCAGLGAYGAFEAAYRLEGQVTYLVVAAPVVAMVAATIPAFAEASFRRRHYLKGLAWSAAFLPAAAVVFLAAAERVHTAKAGAEAERSAVHKAVNRAYSELSRLQAVETKAKAEADKARAQKTCGLSCRTALATEATAKADVEVAREALAKAEARAIAESPLKAPAWLLPATLDIVAFLAIWAGFAPKRRKPSGDKRIVWQPKGRRKRRRRKRVASLKHVKAQVIPLKVVSKS